MGLFSKKTTVPATGYYALPNMYRALYDRNLNAASSALYDEDGKIKNDLFTPLPTTADEQAAFDIARNRMAPTQESLTADVNMLMNPYNDFVINDINRQAAGENSLVNQLAGRAGQIGSNRSFLGTSDVEQNRLNNIGQFRQNQYNTAINQALSVLPALRQQDISNLMNVGSFERGLDTATRQAPITGVQTAQDVLNGVRTEFGNFGTPETTIKTGGGLGGILGAVGSIAGTALGGPVGGAIGGNLGSLFGGGGGNPLAGLASSALGSIGGAAGFGLSTGGQGLFSGGFSNMINSARGAYGPGF